MLRALLLPALAPEPACGARDGDGVGAHAYSRPTGQGAGEQASRDAESGIPVTGVAKSRSIRPPTRRRSCADPRYARCSSPPPGCPQPTRRTWCGTWPAGTGRPMHLRRADTLAPGRSARRHDRPPARLTRQTPGMRLECVSAEAARECVILMLFVFVELLAPETSRVTGSGVIGSEANAAFRYGTWNRPMIRGRGRPLPVCASPEKAGRGAR
jgi:hypothetical protein